MDHIVQLVLATLIGFFVGSYIPAYMKRKGENLATHEDIDKLIDQVRAVTQTTKEIEAKISDELWNRQKRWELKRDVLFEMARKAAHETQVIAELYGVYTTEKRNAQKGLPERTDKRLEVVTAWNNAAADFEGTQMIVSATCGLELANALYDFGGFMRELSVKISEGNPEAFSTAAKDVIAKIRTITLAIRKELGIPEAF